VAYNYRPNSNKYAVNCQLSNKTQIDQRKEDHTSGEWSFYENVKTVSNNTDFLLFFILDLSKSCKS
jgi:hypothetical protein